MLIAKRSFSAVYDGERVEIVAGQTLVGPDHELVRRFPDAWEEEPTEVKARTTAKTNGKARSRQPDRPRLTAQQETAVRAARIREIEQRERDGWQPDTSGGLSREAGPESRREEAEREFWRGVDRLLADPKQEAEAAAARAFQDDLAASDARRLRAERLELTDWLGLEDDEQ